MSTPRRDLRVTAQDGFLPAIGRAIWMLDDTRQRTLALLADLPEECLDWTPPTNNNTIGTLLYHIALIEADWLCAEVLETPTFPPDLAALFPAEVRDAAGQLTVVRGPSLADHLARFTHVRNAVHATFRALTLADYRRVRHLPDYEVTPEWVLHHLMQHEAEHRGQIGLIRELYDWVRTQD